MAGDEGCDSRRPSVSATEGRAPSREQTIPSRGAPPGVCLTHTTRGRGVLCILLAHGPRVDGSVILTGTEMKNHVLALKIPPPTSNTSFLLILHRPRQTTRPRATSKGAGKRRAWRHGVDSGVHPSWFPHSRRHHPPLPAGIAGGLSFPSSPSACSWRVLLLATFSI